MVIHFINRRLQLTSVLLKGGCALEIPEAASLRAVSQEVFKFSDIEKSINQKYLQYIALLLQCFPIYTRMLLAGTDLEDKMN